jgi:hypothetical protein
MLPLLGGEKWIQSPAHLLIIHACPIVRDCDDQTISRIIFVYGDSDSIGTRSDRIFCDIEYVHGEF